MDQQYPIYTVEAECQDCYKCVRHCPVKAIKVEKGHAKVVPNLCVACGNCVEICPVHAKHIRDDLGRARRLLASGRPVYLSLAPSWVSEFSDCSQAVLLTALKRLGFAGISETALGAQEVSTVIARQLAEGRPGLHLSSACPSAVSYLQKYLPNFAKDITPVLSPVLAHCRLLRAEYGAEIAIVFAGPCIAKKSEADHHPDLLDLVLTFRELRQWFEQEGVDLAALTPDGDIAFVPEAAEEGALYPVEGGMIETIKAHGLGGNGRLATITGLRNMIQALEGMDTARIQTPVFVECLACEGGCINGPCMSGPEATLRRRLEVESYAKIPELPVARTPQTEIDEHFEAQPVAPNASGEDALKEALSRVGKHDREDELNCGGCGYSTCRAFAAALLEGKAEPTMCVSYMRKLAQKKANALLRSMPAGVVIVDQQLRIIECNERFAKMFGEENAQVFEVCPGLENCLLAKVIPFAHLFEKVLQSGRDIHYDIFRHEDKLFDITIFTVEPKRVVGAVIFDVTRQELRRDQIAQRANEVIQRNLSTVQEIACRLGEHMADTEILLRSIAEGFAVGEKSLLPGSDTPGGPGNAI